MGLVALALASFHSAVGLSAAPAKLAAFERWLGGPHEDPAVAHDMATYRRVDPKTGKVTASSTCGLGCRAALREGGLVDHRISESYRPRIGRVIGDLEQLGAEHHARVAAPHASADPLPDEGDIVGVAIDDPAHGHVYMVASTPERHSDGTVTFRSYDAGQVTTEGHQAVAEKVRTWRWDASRGAWVDRSRSLTPGVLDGAGERVVSWWVQTALLEDSATPTDPAPAPTSGSSPGPSGSGPAASGALERPRLARGARGPAVGRWQAFLGVMVDNDFGTVTEAATKRAQTAAGLKPDGVVGPLTWALADRRSSTPATTSPIARAVGDVVGDVPERERTAVDVSAAQFAAGSPDWQRVSKVAAVGWARALLGLGTRDTTATVAVPGMKSAGMLAGVYGVPWPRHGRPQDAPEQARQLADTHRALGCTVWPMVDFEPVDDGGATPAERAEALLLYVRSLVALSIRPIVYVGLADWIAMRRAVPELDALGAFPLMLAAYVREQPKPPAPWTKIAVWQRLGSAPGFVGAVDGIRGAVDVSTVNVPLSELRAA